MPHDIYQRFVHIHAFAVLDGLVKARVTKAKDCNRVMTLWFERFSFFHVSSVIAAMLRNLDFCKFPFAVGEMFREGRKVKAHSMLFNKKSSVPAKSYAGPLCAERYNPNSRFKN